MPEPGNPQAFNRYSYCIGNPLKYIDPSGHSWDDFLDFVRKVPGYETTANNLDTALVIVQHPEASAGEKVLAGGYIAVEAIAHGALLVGGGILAWEAIGAFAGAVAGGEAITTAGTAATAACADGDCTNEVTAGVQTAQQGLNAFSRAAEFGIRTYNQLREQIAGAGLRAHHIIEQRFATRLGLDTGQMRSVALTPEEHQMFTNAWRSQIGYGVDYTLLTVDDIWLAAQQVYADYPELLEAARQTLFGP